MTETNFRALCARMADELDHYRQLLMDDRRETHALATEARAALDQPESVADLATKLLAESKPMDPEMAAVLTTEARWDLYEGSPTPQPEPVEPTDEELLEMWHSSDWFNEGATLREFISIARAVLARWGTPANTTREESFDA
jgi:hypothetical protein